MSCFQNTGSGGVPERTEGKLQQMEWVEFAIEVDGSKLVCHDFTNFSPLRQPHTRCHCGNNTGVDLVAVRRRGQSKKMTFPALERVYPASATNISSTSGLLVVVVCWSVGGGGLLLMVSFGQLLSRPLQYSLSFTHPLPTVVLPTLPPTHFCFDASSRITPLRLRSS